MRGGSFSPQLHSFELLRAEQAADNEPSCLGAENKQVDGNMLQNGRLCPDPHKEGLLLGRSVIRRHSKVTIITYRSEVVRHPS